MQRVTLRTTGLETSVVGFGGASLTAHRSPAQAVRLLEEAHALGITHFDVARLYGFGQAEGILGEFLRGKRDRVTVTTKFGLQPGTPLARHRRLVSVARRVARALPFVARAVRRRSPNLVSTGAFDPAQAAASLETSLRELRTDYVDVLLLHECTLRDACREDLLRFLDGEVARGRVRHYGMGTAAANLQGDAALFPEAYRVLQFENSAADPALARLKNTAGRDLITHSAVSAARRLAEIARSRPDWAAPFSAATGADLSDPSTVAALLLRYAVDANPGGVVLFATTRRENLASNLRGLGPGYTPDQLSAFARFVRHAVAPAAGQQPGSERPGGEAPDGEAPDGEAPDGERPDGVGGSRPGSGHDR